ncbi:hypothetical protein [Thalassovita aquimarina]|uniref:Uncharacterized protein n=1 Tax=Thalassovita aquimarina TaxID=2785917 RepID=A0ABS5HPN5_9RHOB|nr:hypothetical protein [Thalassovita aquimarina]MBR9650922.1 hypothetical protein [Thalassovita aquimarina]
MIISQVAFLTYSVLTLKAEQPVLPALMIMFPLLAPIAITGLFLSRIAYVPERAHTLGKIIYSFGFGVLGYNILLHFLSDGQTFGSGLLLDPSTVLAVLFLVIHWIVCRGLPDGSARRAG